MISEPICKVPPFVVSQLAKDRINAAVASRGNWPYIEYTGRLQDVSFCDDQNLHEYIQSNKFNVHPCSSIHNVQYITEVCGSFTATAPPALEVSIGFANLFPG
jgi:hypothetical protein